MENKIITFSIVDDDAYSCSRLIALLQEIAPNFKYKLSYQNPIIALKSIQNDGIDVLFLDVEMPQMDGIQLSAKLRDKGFRGRLVFITAYDQYILEALRNNAFDYLLKPIDQSELEKAIVRCTSEIIKDENTFENLQLYGLSQREIEITKKIFFGLTSKEIGEDLYISKHTVDTHRRNILRKTNCSNTTQLLKLL